MPFHENSKEHLPDEKQVEAIGFAEKINYTLYDISNAVNTIHNSDELYQSIYESLNKLIPLPNFYIAIYDKINGSINFKYFIDEYDNDFPIIENLKEPSSNIGEVILGKRPLFLKENALLEKAKKHKYQGTLPKVWLGVPLIIQEKVIGVVCVQSYSDPDYFSHRHLEILICVSDLIAIAIEREQIPANNVIHDFNDLLSEIMGHLELLSIDQENLSGNQKNSITSALNSTRRAARLIKGIQTRTKQDGHEPLNIDPAQEEQESKDQTKKMVLVIEDENPLRDMVAKALKIFGYNVIEACDGEIAIGIYKKNHHLIDAVLLDIIIPKISGIETFKQILKINPSARIIIASGHVTNQDQRKMFKKASAYLDKPYQLLELKESLQSILD